MDLGAIGGFLGDALVPRTEGSWNQTKCMGDDSTKYRRTGRAMLGQTAATWLERLHHQLDLARSRGWSQANIADILAPRNPPSRVNTTATHRPWGLLQMR